MALTTVYIWGNLDITGHVSVDIGVNYMSFHPKHAHKSELNNWASDIAGIDGYLANYDDDFDSVRPIKSIYIDWLDTDAMDKRIAYYDGLIENNDLTYRLFTHNCSTLAVELLCVGASREFSRLKSITQIINSIKRQPFKHDHGRILELAREALEDFTVLCAQRGRMGRLSQFLVPSLMVDLITRQEVWTPGDVIKFATALQEENHSM